MDQKQKNEKRWFIWTLVFLVVAGTLLVVYINYSSVIFSNNASAALPIHRSKITPPPTKTAAPVKNLKMTK